MDDHKVRKAAELAARKLAELSSRQWATIAEQKALASEYDAALADLVAFGRMLSAR